MWNLVRRWICRTIRSNSMKIYFKSTYPVKLVKVDRFSPNEVRDFSSKFRKQHMHPQGIISPHNPASSTPCDQLRYNRTEFAVNRLPSVCRVHVHVLCVNQAQNMNRDHTWWNLPSFHPGYIEQKQFDTLSIHKGSFWPRRKRATNGLHKPKSYM